MATNREKYIDKASDKQLAIILSSSCYIDDRTKKLTQKVTGVGCIKRASDIEKWLSQEAEENKKAEESKLEARIDELEKFKQYCVERLQTIDNKHNELKDKTDKLEEVMERLVKPVEDFAYVNDIHCVDLVMGQSQQKSQQMRCLKN